MANRKRTPFNPVGPYVMRRTDPIGGIRFEKGQVVTRDDLPVMNDHKLELLFEARWFDIAPKDAKASRGPSKDVQSAKPAEGAPAKGAGKADAAPSEGKAGADGEGGSPSVTEKKDDEKPKAEKPAAYKSFGFGRFWAIDKDGEKQGDHLTKSEAEGRAKRDGVPLLGQNETLGD